jgi:undecaprenyl diphosphate synthase
LEIDIITVWIFSLDNFTRGDDEVAGLMNLFERKFMELVTSQKIHKNQIRICSIGRLDALPSRVRKSILLRVSPHLILCLLILRSQAGVLDARRAPGTPALSALA